MVLKPKTTWTCCDQWISHLFCSIIKSRELLCWVPNMLGRAFSKDFSCQRHRIDINNFVIDNSLRHEFFHHKVVFYLISTVFYEPCSQIFSVNVFFPEFLLARSLCESLYIRLPFLIFELFSTIGYNYFSNFLENYNCYWYW